MVVAEISPGPSNPINKVNSRPRPQAAFNRSRRIRRSAVGLDPLSISPHHGRSYPLSLLAIVASKSCAKGGARQRRRKEGEGRSPNPAGRSRRSSAFSEIIPADKDPTLLALGYSGDGLTPLLNLPRGAPDWGYQGKSVDLTLNMT
ncbi:hypothetical protein U1Q18_001424 [Sarracenia purpurea var. burkii]